MGIHKQFDFHYENYSTKQSSVYSTFCNHHLIPSFVTIYTIPHLIIYYMLPTKKEAHFRFFYRIICIILDIIHASINFRLPFLSQDMENCVVHILKAKDCSRDE